MKFKLLLILLIILFVSSCGSYRSKESNSVVMDYYSWSSPHQKIQMRVFPLTENTIDSLPDSEFFSNLSSMFIPILILPGLIIDCIFYLPRAGYSSLTKSLFEPDSS